ncbi:hypothetical protein llap_11808 [Limosa lapponica baueri]|uniref:Uncharacterized protein n=1 Tax=Limosa lapponica baueri TaxID=1758121 RepID=A0A2I0TVP8_LIMLA|nr:hypothetical protein llap_11808 [Limosa lapponica baueri]
MNDLPEESERTARTRGRGSNQELKPGTFPKPGEGVLSSQLKVPGSPEGVYSFQLRKSQLKFQSAIRLSALAVTKEAPVQANFTTSEGPSIYPFKEKARRPLSAHLEGDEVGGEAEKVPTGPGQLRCPLLRSWSGGAGGPWSKTDTKLIVIRLCCHREPIRCLPGVPPPSSGKQKSNEVLALLGCDIPVLKRPKFLELTRIMAPSPEASG